MSLDELLEQWEKQYAPGEVKFVQALRSAIDSMEWWCEQYETETETEMQETLNEQKFTIRKMLEG